MMFEITTVGQMLREAQREVREKWSDQARLASAAARRARAGHHKDLDKIHKDKRAEEDARHRRRQADAKGGGGKAEDPKVAEITGKITDAQKTLSAMAARRETGTPEYRQLYAQYKALIDQKRSLSGKGRPSAPPVPDKEEPAEKKTAARPGRMVLRAKTKSRR